MRFHLRTVLLLSMPLLTVALKAQSSPPPMAQAREVRIPKIRTVPHLEQFFDGKGRDDMARIDDFRQRQPGDGVPASRKTTVWIGYDDRNFYAAFVCESPEGRTRARLSKREDIMSDDIVGLFLDTYHDRQRNYEFFVNALGIQADGISTDAQGDDMSFDTLWYSQGRQIDGGFAVLMTIPFRSLRFSAADVQTWGFALGRFIPSNNESSFWPFLTQKVDGFSRQLGTLTGLENISAGRNLQFIPYAAFGRSHYLDQANSPQFRDQSDFRAGLDAKAVIHDSLTLDVALNPDFSQVESDDPQVTVNQRFEVVFPEKRPFFLENANYFSTPENLFFSRRIVDPEFGARLTGKLGHWNLGLLGMDDRAPGVDTGGDHAAIGILRVQREFGNQSNAGILVTDREFAGSYNRVEAADMKFRFNANWSFTGQAIASQTRELDGTEYGGPEFNLDLHRSGRNYNYDLSYTDRSEGFHTDLGYVPRVNMRQLQQFLGHPFHPKSKKVLAWAPQLFQTVIFDHQGVQQDWRAGTAAWVELPGSTFMSASYAEAFERFQDRNFRHHDRGFGIHTEYFKFATFDMNYSEGNRINYDAPAALGPFLGSGRDMNANLTFRPTSRIKLDEIYFLSQLWTNRASVFTNHLIRSRVNYQFNRELSLRLILDYNGLLPNPALINVEKQKRVTGDVLLTYLIHPGTALYLGYTDLHENLALVQGAGVIRTAYPSTTTSRGFFAKVSYLLRF